MSMSLGNMKTAIQEAAELYEKHNMVLSDDLTHYLKHGYVFVTPDRVLLARPIDLSKGQDHWLGDHREGNAWLVKLAVGKHCIPWFLQQIPFYKPFVAWGRDFLNRKAELHVYPIEKILRRYHVHQS